MAKLEQVKVKVSTVPCDGGGGSSGHPLVYLNTGDKGWVDCPYCGKRYVLVAEEESKS